MTDSPMVDVSIVIVNWNTKELLLNCLASIEATTQTVSYETWLVDNGSSDGSIAAVAEQYPTVKIIANGKNLGFAAANNKALQRMQGQYALLLNTDTVLTNGAIAALHDFMQETPKAAMACGQLLNKDGSKQNSFANFPSVLSLLVNETLLRLLFPKTFPSKRHHYDHPIQIDSGIGACLLVRKEAMDQVGLLDEIYFFFFEETDWARKMHESGWQSWYIPTAQIYHLQGQSAGDNVQARIMFYTSRYIYLQRWHPKSVGLMKAILLLRLAINLSINSLFTLFSFGLAAKPLMKAKTYFKLMSWHYTRNSPEDKTAAISK